MPTPHPASLPDPVLLGQCDLARGRAGGPGGQHRNKVETKVTLTHTPTGIQAQASERRSAMENQKVALRRLRLALAAGVRRSVPAGDQRSDLWRSRCTPDGKLAINPRHPDYPALLAEALDMIEASALDLPKAALRLCCTPSQLLKLVKDHPPAFEALNKQRAARRRRPLK
jgi:hypothetical protein